MPRIVSSLSPAAVLACIALLAFASQTGAAHGRSGLSATHERWLEDVELLISKKERRTFLSLREDRHRDGFIAKFWEARDPDPKTPDNPFREQFLSRLKEARELYPEVDDRFQVHALNGPPSQEFEAICDEPIHSLVVWDYWHSEHVGGPLSLIFYRYPGGNWRILDPDSGPEILGVDPARLEGRNFVEVVESSCSAPTHIQVRITNSLQQYMRYSKSFIVPALSSPRNYDPEWLEAFLASSVEGVEPEVEPAREARRKPGGKYQEWLEEVRFLISRRERKAFLALEKDYQRDAFIRDFWEARDPDSSTPGNRFKDTYLARLEEAEERYVTPIDDRIRVFALNGDPSELYETSCGRLFWPLEFWIYNYSEHARSRLVLVLYQRFDTGPFRLWDPSEGYEALLVDPAAYARYRSDVTDRVENGEIGPSALRLATFHAYLERDCTESRQMIELIANTLEIYTTRGQSEILAATRRPENEAEWLPSFKAFSTELEPGRTKLDAELSFEFPGRHQQRTVVRGVFAVPESAAQVQELAGRRSYNFALTGEVLRAGELFESFKVVFDVPQPDAGSGSGGQALPLVFERWLRPGDYQLIVKLEDIIGGAAFREDRELTVPQRRGGGDAAQTDVPDFFGAPAEDTDLELRAEGKDFQRGYVRFSAQIEGGEVAEVAFFVEGEPVMTKTRPPFSVDLSVGDLETLSVRAVAYDAAGGEIATDEMLVNAGDYAFAVRLIEPRNGSQVVGASVRVRARVETPVDGRLERVEFFVNDQRVTTLFQPPFSAEVLLDGDALTVIRALAFLDDGNSAEAVAIVNSAQYLETVDVRLVEVFASVLDDSGRPIAELDRDAFQVLENGSEQAILRFERLEDLPIHVGLMIDTSASMAERIVPVKDAAVRFLEQAVRPQDRASVITFDEQPRMAAAFTNDLTTLIGALAGLRTGRGTALYDCLLFSLYSFRGLTGQRALLLLSDGEDRRSRSTFDEVREFALRSGVTIYTIGLRKGMTRRGKSELVRLADETGGRAFLIEDIPELDAIYEAIQKDLRSKYFLAYQPSTAEGRGFRTIEIRVDRPGVEVRALRGYLPRSSG